MDGGFAGPERAGVGIGAGDQAQLCILHALLPAMASRAERLDREAAYPEEDTRALGGHAALAPFPRALGGLGLGTDPEMAAHLAAFLRGLGAAHVAIGRLFEAHVNAVRLLWLYGTRAQLSHAAEDARHGLLIGLWVTDAPEHPLRLVRNAVPPATRYAPSGQPASALCLAGGKAFCSGAGHLRRALVTAAPEQGMPRLLYLETDPARATVLAAPLQGVRCATTGQVDFSGQAVPAECIIGAAGDYLREPAFSAGAWRASAVTAGCLEALVDTMMESLAARGRAGAPLQQARIGHAIIARETALLWLDRVAKVADHSSAAPTAHEGHSARDLASGDSAPMDAEAILAEVHLARIAIETSCVEALNLAERAMGLQAYLSFTKLERLRRDLSTYLRQPAPDEVLAQAADYTLAARLRSPAAAWAAA